MKLDLQKRADYFSCAPQDISLKSLDLSSLPRHIAIIMDGNGRWAEARGLPRAAGHKAGVISLRETVTACVRLGIDALSVFAFSTENWKRPATEVNLLMQLFAKTLVAELPLFTENNVRLRFFGDIEALPKKTRDIFYTGLQRTAQHTGMVFSLAVNYGSRSELVRAAQNLAKKAADGEIVASDISEELFSEELFSKGLPDPELLIRTSGELRLSNFLLWQLAYAEFYSTAVFWPDFNRFDLLRAIKSFQARDRRFGGLKSQENNDSQRSPFAFSEHKKNTFNTFEVSAV